MKDHDRESRALHTPGNLRFWRDRFFWLALAAAPVCWLLLALTVLPVAALPLNLQILFWSVLVYPVLEEMVFRGGLQTFLYSRSTLSRERLGISLANLITSFVFAAMHLLSQSPAWAALVFLPSLVFGAARDRFQGVSASILLHMFYNAGFIALFVR